MTNWLTAKTANELYGKQLGGHYYKKQDALLDLMKRHGFQIYQVKGYRAVTREDVIKMAEIVSGRWENDDRVINAPSPETRREFIRQSLRQYGEMLHREDETETG